MLRGIERLAWAWQPSRGTPRLFVTLAVGVTLVTVTASLTATLISARNAATVADAQDRGLRVASSVTEFRDLLGAADSEVAGPLVSGEEGSSLSAARYQADLLAAGLALTDAGLAATGQDADDIAALAEGLARYADLVETSDNYPAGSIFSRNARELARGELVPTADRVRRSSEQQLSDAAGSVGGPVAASSAGGLVVALVVSIGAALIVAGRTRRFAHPALLGAAALVVVNIVVSGTALVAQSRELGRAASDEVEDYLAANAIAFSLLDLRADELDVVADLGGSGAQDRLDEDAAALVVGIEEGPEVVRALHLPAQAYVAAVQEALDGGTGGAGNDEGEGRATLGGAPALAYREVRGLAGDTVTATEVALSDRLDAGADSGVAPLVPATLGLAAAGLAAAGVLVRGRRYR